MTEHLPVQRWAKVFTRYPASEVLPNENGEYVTYADHLAALRDCEERVLARVLDSAREATAKTHQPIPVIECACGWGVNCPECGPVSNRTVGHVCSVCCDDWGDHGYCDDMHNEDGTPLHHPNGVMWSGPHCPVIALIDALRGES